MARKIKGKLSMLREWRKVVQEAAKVIKKIYPDAEIYVIGGAAENRLTIHSDIDLAVIFKERDIEKAEVLARIWEALEDKIPIYYPLEIHILHQKDLCRIRGKVVKIA
ncbi:MAG: nucleotidyltransferase domain-containing protein [Desulfurococcales archaeon]|nr:nucleotidyltransferase domain-containing protein [Desulfurococcales archaeon]